MQRHLERLREAHQRTKNRLAQNPWDAHWEQMLSDLEAEIESLESMADPLSPIEIVEHLQNRVAYLIRLIDGDTKLGYSGIKADVRRVMDLVSDLKHQLRQDIAETESRFLLLYWILGMVGAGFVGLLLVEVMRLV